MKRPGVYCTRFHNRVEQEWSSGQGAKNAEDTWLSHLSLLGIIIQDGNIFLEVRDLVRQVKEMFLPSVLKRGRSISCVGEVGEIERGGRNPSHQPRQKQ